MGRLGRVGGFGPRCSVATVRFFLYFFLLWNKSCDSLYLQLPSSEPSKRVTYGILSPRRKATGTDIPRSFGREVLIPGTVRQSFSSQEMFLVLFFFPFLYSAPIQVVAYGEVSIAVG